MGNPCFVLGLFDTGLAVVRALGRAGLPVFGFDWRESEYGFRSRFGSHAVCPHPGAGAELVAFLHERARAVGGRPIIYPTSDAFVLFLSEYREALSPQFHYILPSRASIEAALDKSQQYSRAAAAGVPVPSTQTPRSMEEVVALSDALDYPVVVKPLVGHLWRETFRGDKAMRIDDAAGLVLLYQQIFDAGHSALVQPFVPGPNSNHCKVCAYFDRDGQPRATICMRKVRQYPVDFGVGTLMESVADPDLEALGLRLFRAMEWRGPGSIEFKRDDRDGRWKLIELNPRLWQQHALAEACGVNFPLLQYHELTGREYPIGSWRAGVRWLDEFRDPRSVLDHRRRGGVSLVQWMRSLAGVRVSALWALDDPAPFLAAARDHFSSAYRKMSPLPWRAAREAQSAAPESSEPRTEAPPPRSVETI